ncbi:MAG: cytochrome c oxidase assembly protein [Solirubrobacterales bacterium]|nr:cytochrome c oxidase assembly protein [Solirubrobacterales bacterium]
MDLTAPILATAGPVNGIVPSVIVLLCWLPYRARVRALSHERRAVPGWRQACFAAGLISLAGALSAPVDSLADELLTAHMAEHLVIGDLSALLLVLGFTGPLLAPLLRVPWLAPLRIFAHPLVALPAWMISFYVWHLPALYQAALRHDWVHGLQHACFLAFGIAVWMALLGPLPKPSWFGNAARLVYIVVVRLAGTVLANVLIFSGTVLYPIYRVGDAHWHISPMGDQIAAAGLMMVEESVLTIGLFCWLFLKVARESDERQQLLETAAARGIELDERRAARAVAAGRGDELLERLKPPAPQAHR